MISIEHSISIYGFVSALLTNVPYSIYRIHFIVFWSTMSAILFQLWNWARIRYRPSLVYASAPKFSSFQSRLINKQAKSSEKLLPNRISPLSCASTLRRKCHWSRSWMTSSLNKEGLDPMIASYAGSQSIFSIIRWRKIKLLEKVQMIPTSWD